MFFSVIIPIYNVEKYLSRCIESIIKQTYSSYEIILVNDGSTDNSLLIAEEYRNKYSNISVINKKNGGLSDARNAGLSIAKGKYVIFLDSDDGLEKEALKKIYCSLENQEDIDIVAGDCKLIYPDTEVIKARYVDNKTNSILTGSQFLKEQISHKQMFMNATANIYSKSFLDKNQLRFKTGILHEDEEFTPRVFLKAEKVKCLTFAFYDYYIRYNSITQTKDYSRNARDLYSTLSELESIYDDIGDDELKKLLKNTLSEKYLYMAQNIYNSELPSDISFDSSFVRRNAYDKVTKCKADLFSFSKKLYFNVNQVCNRVIPDINKSVLKKPIVFLFIFFAVVFLSRYFYFYRGDSGLIYSIYLWGSRLFSLLSLPLFIINLKRKKVKISISVIGLYLLLNLINLINKGDVRSMLSSSYPIISLVILFEFISYKREKLFVTDLYATFFILVFLNLIQMFFFPQWIDQHQYLLGMRNQIGIVLIINLFVADVYSKMIKVKCLMYVSLTMVLLTVLLGGSLNNLLAFAAIIILLFIKNNKKVKVLTNIKSTLLFYIIYYISVVLLRIQNLISPIIEIIFHRATTLSGRTIIWDAAIPKIIQNPLFGYGHQTDTNYFFTKRTWPSGQVIEAFYSAHNTFLQQMYETGILPILYFVFMLFSAGKLIAKDGKEFCSNYFIYLFAMLIIYSMEAIGYDGIIVLTIIGVIVSSIKKAGDLSGT